jgi:hypothetical protein
MLPRMTDVTITIHDLRSTVAILLDGLEDQLGSTVELGADYYWAIDPDSVYSYAPVSNPMVGQLSDDVATVRSALVDGAAPVEIWHVLRHVNGILARLAWLSAHQSP